MDFTDVAQLATVAGVLSAIVLQILEWRRARLSRGIDTLLTFDARFSAAEMRALRRRGAVFLLACIDGEPDDAEGRLAAKAVLNFFEAIGFLHSKGVVDAGSIWQFFAPWLLCYFEASKQFRARVAKGDPFVYCELERVFEAVKRVEEKKHPTHQLLHMTSAKALRSFLSEESKLDG